ncbi:twin-arginine translocase TatA/TatE family subunit [Microbacterium sp. PRF11]|jgi:sec-independent protein translocase protein TatA|uniref:twin-arginine translocase TatA/TatE family subunit n=1 Tax=Microbacterium sp. PRF11 TaxID=2962593 RepID=UPI0028810A38|nr:twin-arginine translocase TatA/TatE family subunit [Microbacterium sp. PRF11]MDT0117012.1 twin-arginine translocase TatA/TatE family subunit [Microbacterium sp. PRF11]
MLHGLTGWHLLIVLAVILLLFGAAKLPALAQSVGKSARLFKGEMKAMKDEDETPLAAPTTSSHPGPGTPAVASDPPPIR